MCKCTPGVRTPFCGKDGCEPPPENLWADREWNFGSYPRTIGEIRSDQSGKGSDWTPREALIAMLREIDSGRVKPDALVICFRHSGNKTSFMAATPDGLTTLGLLERVKFRLHEVAGR